MRELRGGVLIPSFDDRRGEDGDDRFNQNDDDVGGGVGRGISFDAFFDANDHSVGYYCSIADVGGDIPAEGGGGRWKVRGVDGRRGMMAAAVAAITATTKTAVAATAKVTGTHNNQIIAAAEETAAAATAMAAAAATTINYKLERWWR
jgi:hypothetical protein